MPQSKLLHELLMAPIATAYQIICGNHDDAIKLSWTVAVFGVQQIAARIKNGRSVTQGSKGGVKMLVPSIWGIK